MLDLPEPPPHRRASVRVALGARRTHAAAVEAHPSAAAVAANDQGVSAAARWSGIPAVAAADPAISGGWLGFGAATTAAATATTIFAAAATTTVHPRTSPTKSRPAMTSATAMFITTIIAAADAWPPR